MAAELRGSWRLLIAAAGGVMLSVSALPAFVLGVFALPMTREFGWSLAAYNAGTLAFSVGILLASAPVGALCDRRGARWVALRGLPLLALGLAGLALVQAQLWTFYLAMAIASLLASATLPTVWTRLINGVFERERGMALGLVLSGSSVFLAFGPALAQWLIERQGWRMTWLLLALLPLLIAWPLAIAWFRGNERLAPAAAAAASAPAGIGAALRAPRFWALALGFTLVTLGVGALNPNLVPMLQTKGYSAAEAAQMLAALGVSMGAGRIAIGYVVDRVWAPGVAAIVLALPAASALLLLGPDVSPGTALLAIGLLGFAQGAEYDFLAYLVARYFGLERYGRLYGLILMSLVLATAAGAIGVGRVRDLSGSFDPALPAVAVVFALGAALMLALGRYPASEGSRAH